MSTARKDNGKQLMLQALAGQATGRVPVALITWGFDYTWKVAGMQPWQLACGGAETWLTAYRAMRDRHNQDAIFYFGVGQGPEEPTLVGEDARRWLVRDNNTGGLHALMKDSLALVDLQTGAKTCDAVGDIRAPADADRLIPLPRGHGQVYLDGLARLIHEVGESALVMPCCSPGYIMGCYALGFERAMQMMLVEPELFTYVCDRYAFSEQLRMRQLAAAGAEAVYIADSWASCDIISPALFARFALPYQRSVAQAAREAGLHPILWNLGDIVPILHLEADLPLDAFAFEQPRKGWRITVADVRRVFGSQRCLFGNLDSEALLLRNDPAEIRCAVAEQLDQSGSGAPFILSTGSPLPSDIDPSAVDAIMNAVSTLGLSAL